MSTPARRTPAHPGRVGVLLTGLLALTLASLPAAEEPRLYGIEVFDGSDRRLAENRNYQGDDALTDVTIHADGDYYVRLFHFTHTQGTAEHFYRFTVSTAPWIDAVFPCAVEPGKTTSVTVWGRNLPGGKLDPSAVIEDRVLEKITVNVTAPPPPPLPRSGGEGGRLAFSGLVPPKSAALDGFEKTRRR